MSAAVAKRRINHVILEVIENDVQGLKAQHEAISADIKEVETRVAKLELADQSMADALKHHVASQENKWKHAFRVWYGIGALVAIMSLEHAATVKAVLLKLI